MGMRGIEMSFPVRYVPPLIMMTLMVLAASPAVVSEDAGDGPIWVSVRVDGMDEMDHVRSEMERLGFELGAGFRYIPFVQALSRRSDLGTILSIPGVADVSEQETIRFCQDISVPAMKASPSTTYSPETAHDLGFTGSGITIAILDGGVDNEHPTFDGAFVAGADFTVPGSPLNPRDGSVDPDDVEGHGTPVASVALGRGDQDGNYMGMAPGAGLIDLKIRKIGPTLSGPMTEAIEWCITNQGTDWGNGYSGVDIISISAGLGGPDGTVAAAVKEAVSRGIVVVSAATNSGTSFSDNPNRDNDYWVDDSIIAGGTETLGTIDRSDDIHWPQSTWGPRTDDGDDDIYDELRPDVSAPGADLNMAAFSRTSATTPASGYNVGSGTSYATPHVSGLVALMLQANPELVPDADINPPRLILHRSSEARGEPYDPAVSDRYDVHFGYGIIDAYEAVEMALAYEDSRTSPYIVSFEAQPSMNPGDVNTITALALDDEEQVLSYELVPESGEVTPGDPPRTWTWEAPEELGTYTFSLTVTDPDGMSDTWTLEVEVISGPVNSAPVIEEVETERTVLEPGGTSGITVTARDPDGDEITYSYHADMGTIVGDGNKATFTAPDAEGSANVRIIATDPSGLSDEARITMLVRTDISGDPPGIGSVRTVPIDIPQGHTDDIVLEVLAVKETFDIASVKADLSKIGKGPSVQMRDDGKAPDTIASDHKYSLLIGDISKLKQGRYGIGITITDSAGLVGETSYDLVIGPPIEGEGDGWEMPSPWAIAGGAVMVFLLLAIIVLVAVRLSKKG